MRIMMDIPILFTLLLVVALTSFTGLTLAHDTLSQYKAGMGPDWTCPA
jgi:hypothetical protein